MRIGNEQTGYKIFVFRPHARPALTATTLRTVGVQRNAFDVAGMRYGHDHIFTLDQIFIIQISTTIGNFCPARCRKLITHFFKLGTNNVKNTLTATQNIKIILDLRRQFVEFVANLVTAQSSQTLQAQIQNGASLIFRKFERTIFLNSVTWIINQLDQRLDVFRWPVTLHQLTARSRRIRCCANKMNNIINVGSRNSQTYENMSTITRFIQKEPGPATNNLFTESNKRFQHILQCKLLRTATIKSHHVTAKALLKLRVTIELVQDNIRNRVTLQLNNNAHTTTI